MDTKSQKIKLLELLKQAGEKGVNTVDVRENHFIVDVPTRIFELKNEDHYPIDKRIEKNRTATYFLISKPEPKQEIEWNFN